MESADFINDPEHIEEYNEYIDIWEMYSQEQEWPEDFRLDEAS